MLCLDRGHMVAMDIALGLSYLHTAQNCLHLDIKVRPHLHLPQLMPL